MADERRCISRCKHKHLNYIRSKVYNVVTELNATFSHDKEPIPFEKRANNQKPIKAGESWGRIFDCAWFHITGTVPANSIGKNLVVLLDVGGEGLYVNAENDPINGLTDVNSIADMLGTTDGKAVINNFKPNGDKVDFYVEAGTNGDAGLDTFAATFKYAKLAEVDLVTREFYFDYLTLLLAKSVKDISKEAKKIINRALINAYKVFIQQGSAVAARAVIATVFEKHNDIDFTFTAVGHAHLDLAWLWPIRESKRKAARTYSNTISYIDRYEDYIFGSSQPQQFEWMKDLQPKLYDRMKTAVKNDRIELQGGMWCECDTNIIGGESLVRQFLYGKRFFKEEFGVDVRTCWLPDVFGYTAALPQIMKKSGIEYFLTIKLSWNWYNKFPLSTFNWEGLDNSKVLVHMPPEGTYNGSGSPVATKIAHNQYKEKNVLNEAMIVYGAGDGGGGPGECHIGMLERQKNLPGFPKIKFGKAIDFFDRINKKRDLLKNHKGELYLETHQGTYTTQSDNKKLNRTIEYALHNLEFIAAIARKNGIEYPKNRIDKIWKEVLLYQFHDIIPGSSITRVYTESVARYKEMLIELEEIKETLLKGLGKNDAKRVINMSPFAREEYIKSNNEWYYTKLNAYSTSTPTKAKIETTDKSSSDDTISNSKFTVKFDINGTITSLIDKATGKEFCKEYLNKLTVYMDKHLYFNAWDIDIDYTKKKKETFNLISFENIIDGPRVIRRNKYSFNKSTLTQDVVLDDAKDYINFVTDVDWHETYKMLRADFTPTVFSDKVTCDIQFGNIKRNTGTATKLDWAQFEICAHKYVDVSTKDYGVAVLSQSKYGWRVKDGLISLNLLRSPVYPDPQADRGEHHFEYAFMPHKADIYNSNVISESYNYNLPLTNYNLDIDFNNIVKSDKANIIIETVKPSEDGKGFIVRAYEAYGVDTVANLDLSYFGNTINSCNLVEEVEEPCKTTNLNFTPFEIKSFYIAK